MGASSTAERPISSTPTWADGDAYEAFMGRWSRKMAPKFLTWVRVPEGARVVDVGSGTGAMAEALLARGAASVQGFDLSPGFVEAAKRRLPDPRVQFTVADAQALPAPDASFDAAVSGLTLNFVPDPGRAVAEMKRVTRPGGIVAAYLWDLARGMGLLRNFWDVAVELDPDRAGPLDEGRRFTLCSREALGELFRKAQLEDVRSGALTIEMPFENFEAYWSPFLGGQGPAPGYLASLDGGARERLRVALRSRVAPRGDGPFTLKARAWAVRGRLPALALRR